MIIVPECGDYYEIAILYIVKKEHLTYFYLLSSSFNKRKGILNMKKAERAWYQNKRVLQMNKINFIKKLYKLYFSYFLGTLGQAVPGTDWY